MTEAVVPRVKVEQIAAQVRELLALKDAEKLTMAQMIRWCVHALSIDPRAYRLRGFESASERKAIIDENLKNARLGLLYLENLATRMEDSVAPASLAASKLLDDPTQSNEG